MAYKYRYGYEEEKTPPLPKLEKRSFVKFLILHILTLGLYSIIFFIPLSYDINKIAPRHGNKTMNFLLAFLLAIPTSNIIMIYWFYQITDHIEEALDRRKIDYDFNKNHFWGWYFLGSFVFIGFYVYVYKLIRAMNLLAADYNERPHLDEFR